MTQPTLHDSRLRRYWFRTRRHLGFGVTAFSLDDARELVEEWARERQWPYEVLEVVEDIDIRQLDEHHVVPNMGPPNFRGVWFPQQSL